MLSNKEISQNFEVQINTLYNWRKSKPKLYNYLRNADYNFEQSKEINVLLKRFSEDIDAQFTEDEVLFFIGSKTEAKSIDDVENIEKLFIKEHHRDLIKDGEMILAVYDKLSALDIIEKYIFYKRAHNLRPEIESINRATIEQYFEEFLTQIRK